MDEQAANFAGRKVLVVDDQELFQEMLEKLLLKLGFDEVDKAPDGSQALKALDTKRYDLILCDIMMSGLGGIDFVRTLRQSANLRFDVGKSLTPVLFMSGSTDMAHVRAAKEVGAQGYLVKPINPATVRKRISKLFN